MTKSELGAFNTYVFENCFPKEQKQKQKIDIQTFKVIEDFYKACKDCLPQIMPKEFDFGGRQEETKIQRKAMMTEWFNYVMKENDAYTGAIQLMILKSITKNLKKDDDTLPPVLNKGILANTVEQVHDKLTRNKDLPLNFDKEYRLNLQNGILKEEKTLDENLNGWIIIPSKECDEENFEQNVEKLKMLSHPNWCTKSFNAEPYLEEGAFHVYMENGKPKLGVRFVGNEIQEIQGELNNSKISVKYGSIAKEHIKSYKLTDDAKEEIKKLEVAEAEIERIKAKFPDRINNAPTQDVLEALGIECKKDKDGMLIISHYGESRLAYSYSDLGIDENRLFKDIKVIEGDVDFRDSQITNLGNLESIGGDVNFRNLQVTSLGSLESIGGNAFFNDSKVTSLGNLKSIGGSADFDNSKVTSLGNLKSIGGYAYFIDSWGSLLKKSDFDLIKVGGEVIAG